MQISKSDLARLNKAKAAMKRAEYAPHASRGLRDARKLLKPLVEKNIAEAQYLAASFVLAHEFKSDAAEKKWRYDLLHKAAESGYARAQFALGQAWHYGDLGYDAEKSAYWFSLSAEQSYPPGQWEHGGEKKIRTMTSSIIGHHPNISLNRTRAKMTRAG